MSVVIRENRLHGFTLLLIVYRDIEVSVKEVIENVIRTSCRIRQI